MNNANSNWNLILAALWIWQDSWFDRPTVRSHIPIRHVFQTFLFPIACFKFLWEWLNAMLSVLVAGSERREDNYKEYKLPLKPIYANWETCHAARIKFQLNFALFISRADCWNCLIRLSIKTSYLNVRLMEDDWPTCFKTRPYVNPLLCNWILDKLCFIVWHITWRGTYISNLVSDFLGRIFFNSSKWAQLLHVAFDFVEKHSPLF